jgi:hypothetical protein
MPPQAKAPPKALPPAQRFRAEIEKARSDGAALSDLVLQLTFSDTARLKRDRSVPTEDIQFVSGELHYLGVKVVEGSAAASALVLVDS